ncbi:MAG: YciI family protein [Opitutales bacterium]|nr:YciI family protein [Opitutales bacterium]NRA25932.1 YciI family protein [Opitutales bacterium]
MHYILFYKYASDYLERRGVYRDEHLSLAKAAIDRGELFLGGAFADPADGAALVFKGDSPEAAESYAKADPYVTNRLVTSWHVREWTTVIGKDAASPIVS